MSSGEVIKRAQEGDREAMEEVLSSLAPRLKRFGQKLCSSYSDDALQESLLTVAQELHGFRGNSELSTWAYSIVRTACGRLTRGKANAPTLPLSEVLSTSDQGSDPEHQLLHEERKAVFNCAIQMLPAEQKEAVLLRDVEELSAKEAALALGITSAALKSRLHRGRSLLSEHIEAGLKSGRRSKGCPDVLGAYSREREGELSPPDCATMKRHLAECHDCDEICQHLKEALKECRSDVEAIGEDSTLKANIRDAFTTWLNAKNPKEQQ